MRCHFDTPSQEEHVEKGFNNTREVCRYFVKGKPFDERPLRGTKKFFGRTFWQGINPNFFSFFGVARGKKHQVKIS